MRPCHQISIPLFTLLESIVASQLTEYLFSNNLLCLSQSAYPFDQGCETALLDISSRILLDLDSGKTVFLVLLNLSTAFDTFDHSMLLTTLSNRYGNTGIALKWLKSYLLTDPSLLKSIEPALSITILVWVSFRVASLVRSFFPFSLHHWRTS